MKQNKLHLFVDDRDHSIRLLTTTSFGMFQNFQNDFFSIQEFFLDFSNFFWDVLEKTKKTSEKQDND